MSEGTPQRLDSLSKRPAVGSKPGAGKATLGRFKPKVVARRPKEERASDAPPDIQRDADSKRGARGARGRGRGRGAARGARGGRGRGGFGTATAAASGPLGGFSFMDTKADTKMTSSFRERSATPMGHSPTPDYLQALSRSATPDIQDSEEDDGLKRINMSGSFVENDFINEFFPVRADREAETDEKVKDANPKPEKKDEGKAETSLMDIDDELKVKDEDDGALGEDKLKKLHTDKMKDIQEKEKEPTSTISTTLEDTNELIKLIHESLVISKKRQEKSTTNQTEPLEGEPEPMQQDEVIDSTYEELENMLLFQFPGVFPRFYKRTPKAATEVESVPGAGESATNMPAVKTEVAKSNQELQGHLGKLRVHKSGKLSMKIGNIVMDVEQGTKPSFLQDCVLINEKTKKVFSLGHLSSHIVVAPDIETLSR